MANAMNKVRTDMAQRFVDALSQGQLPWRACWRQQRPINMTTGKLYRGVNALYLSYIADELGYADPRWCTYKQAQDKGWQVRKGEKSARVEYWAYYDHKQKKILSWEEARRCLAADPNYMENLQLSCRVYSVFNASQMDGVPELLRGTTDIGAVRAQRDTLILNMNVGYREQGDRAYYSSYDDRVTLPPEAEFDDTYSYMATLLHECGHASGHPSRLCRDMSGWHGTPEYAREELRAEIASAFTMQALGLELSEAQMEQHMKQHIAYVQSWAGVLKKNPEELFRAIKAAEEISDYLMEKGEFHMEQTRQKTAPQEWYLVYNSADPMDGELEIVQANELQNREVIETFRCTGKQEALEKLERYEELQRLFWDESDDSETQMWRDDLTSDEAAMVERWDTQAAKGFSRLVQDISDHRMTDQKAQEIIDEANAMLLADMGFMEHYASNEAHTPLSEEAARLAIKMGVRVDLIARTEDYHGSHEDDFGKIPLGVHNVDKFYHTVNFGHLRTSDFSLYRGTAYLSTDYEVSNVNMKSLKAALDHFVEMLPRVQYTLSNHPDGYGMLLRIHGEGAVPGVTDVADRPYQSHADQIREIVVEDGITEIGRNALCDLPALERLSWPITIEKFDPSTLRNCPSLKEIEFQGAQQIQVKGIPSPRELLELAPLFPDLNREALCEVSAGLREGLTMEQVHIYGRIEFSVPQMNAIRYALVSGLTKEQIDLLTHPDFDPVQMDIIRSGFVAGMTMDQVQTFAKPEWTSQQMMDTYLEIQGTERSTDVSSNQALCEDGAELDTPDFEP